MKMKKLIALITASALCLGMSVTAFAADVDNPSPDKNSLPWITPWNNDLADGSNPYNLEIKNQDLSTTKDDLEKKYLAEASLEQIAKMYDLDLKNPDDLDFAKKKALAKAEQEYNTVINTLWNNPAGKENLLKALEENGYTLPDGVSKEDAKPEVLFAGNLKPMDEYGNPADIKEVKWRVDVDYLDNDDEVEVGDTVYVLHYKDDGTWEVIPAVVEKNNENGGKYIIVQFKNGLSPVGIVKVTSNNKLVTLKHNGQAGSVITPPTTDNNGSSNGSNGSTNGSSNGSNGKVTGTANATTAKQAAVTTIGKSPKTGEF